VKTAPRPLPFTATSKKKKGGATNVWPHPSRKKSIVGLTVRRSKKQKEEKTLRIAVLSMMVILQSRTSRMEASIIILLFPLFFCFLLCGKCRSYRCVH
jgi:hypothetical protein